MENMNNENVEVVKKEKLSWLKPVLLSVGSFILGATLMAWLGSKQEGDRTAAINDEEIVDDYDCDDSENLEEEA